MWIVAMGVALANTTITAMNQEFRPLVPADLARNVNGISLSAMH
jgi:hypothetical protein